MNSSGRLIGIARHAKPRDPIEELTSTTVSVEAGIEGDCHGEPGPSQVTVVAEEGWLAATKDLRVELLWTMRRANLLVRGIDLLSSTGKRLQIGELTIEITGENDPCFVMDRQHRGLRKALTPDWRAGVACRVIRGGKIEVGDEVTLAVTDHS